MSNISSRGAIFLGFCFFEGTSGERSDVLAIPNLEEEAKKSGAVAHIYKPFDLSELMEKVKAMLD